VTLDAEDIEAIAQRVAELIADRVTESPRARLVDAHAHQLGAIRLGGPKGRLRFDLATITDRADTPAPVPGRHPGGSRTRGDGRPTTGSPNHLDSATKTYNKSGRAARQRPRP
jgi:hypothetical protein